MGDRRVITAEELGRQFCEVLGIDAKRCALLNIRMRPGSLAEVEASLTVDDETAEGLRRVLEQYHLTPRE